MYNLFATDNVGGGRAGTLGPTKQEVVMAQDLRGKWVLVTGAASGIGRETCLLLAGEGSNLVLADIDESGLASLAVELEALGAEVLHKVTDITDGEQVEALAGEVRKMVGAVDILLNNAGIGYSAELKDTTDEQWERLISINFLGAVRMINAFVPEMISKGRGQIINVSTGQVFYPVPTWGAYAASKAALATYSECLTWELRRFGIKVTTIFPGLINTPFYSEVEAHNPAQKLVLWCIQRFGASPASMAAKIVRGMRRGKRRVIHSWINWLTYLGKRAAPHAYDLAGDTFARALSEKPEA